ncbi:MAG: heavy metal translocating P-type ATPase metal-binding domain-containing protein, partial [Bacteroidota bacterium]
MSVVIENQILTSCYHCGDPCESESIRYEDKDFCCGGCQAVYELFQETDLGAIYDRRQEFVKSINRFDFLESEDISNKLLDFQSATHNRVKLFLPAIHCSSCIYLLENLHRLDKAVIRVTVNFVKKEADILYQPDALSLKDVAVLLASVGYAPNFTKSGKESDKNTRGDNGLSIKLGVAAFCFGNIMLLSFPEYLGFESTLDEKYSVFFSYLNIILALPILFFASRDYFVSALTGLQKRFVNIDVPIALGIITLFFRSTYEVLSLTGPGYFDSLAGLVFFLLIGKWFQSKTYQNLSFERDYKSYFPLASLRLVGQKEISTPIDQLDKGDLVITRNGEIIPADGMLMEGEARIDYSFVTGESRPIKVKKGEMLYAGGRQLGQRIKTTLLKKSSQSYLTNLWNSQVFKTETDGYAKLLVNKVSKYFTAVVLSIALLSFGYWFLMDKTVMWQAFTAVLIVACPCALALSAPFTNGNMLRWMGKAKLYLKGADVIESLAQIDTLVFDKTGTLTTTSDTKIDYRGEGLSELDFAVLKAMTGNSTHPISQKIHNFLSSDTHLVLDHFKELPGKGLVAIYNEVEYKLGSNKWLGNGKEIKSENGNV